MELASTMCQDEYLPDADEDIQGDKYLLFQLLGVQYGIDISSVTSIEEMRKITPIPDMPDYVKGVIHLRGKVPPVIDLRLRFGMEKRDYDDRTCIIVIMIESYTFGIIVDTVAEVMEIPSENIEPPPTFKKKDVTKKRFISGIGKINTEIKILLDVRKLIDLDYLKSIESEANEENSL